MRIPLFGIVLNCFSVVAQQPELPAYDSIVKTDGSTLTHQTDPSFPGGWEEFDNFIRTNIVYPESFINMGLRGRVSVKLTVEQDGTVSNVTILRGMTECPECDKEIKRLFESMPKWIPARNNGEAVRSYVNIPVTLRMH